MFTVEEVCEEQERQYNQLMEEDDQYCHPESFKWGFEHGVDYALNKFGWHPASELPIVSKNHNWVSVIAIVCDIDDNSTRATNATFNKDKGWIFPEFSKVLYWCYPPKEDKK